MSGLLLASLLMLLTALLAVIIGLQTAAKGGAVAGVLAFTIVTIGALLLYAVLALALLLWQAALA